MSEVALHLEVADDDRRPLEKIGGGWMTFAEPAMTLWAVSTENAWLIITIDGVESRFPVFMHHDIYPPHKEVKYYHRQDME
jgi:hypothetical protein